MTPEDERLLDRYVRAPDALPADRREAAEALLAEDPAASAYADFVAAFSDRRADEADRARSARVDDFVDGLFSQAPATVIPLRPFHGGAPQGPTVLAADTAPDAGDTRFSVLSTLAAEDPDVLVRVLGDHERGEGRLYVLSKVPAHQSHVVVSFPELELNLLTGDHGRRVFDLPDHVDAEAWASASASVHRPVATARLASGEATTLDDRSGGAVHCARTDSMLTVTLAAHATASSMQVSVTAADGPSRLVSVSADAPAEVDVSDGPLELRLYA
jgi:hypothetical protein